MELSLGHPFGKLLPGGFHERAVRTEIRQPEPVDACTFRIQDASVELRSFAGGSAVDDDASEVAHASDGLRDMLASQHFENRVDAFSASEFFDGFHVIALLVVDAMLQAKL